MMTSMKIIKMILIRNIMSFISVKMIWINDCDNFDHDSSDFGQSIYGLILNDINMIHISLFPSENGFHV